MSMCRVFSCFVERGCLLWPVSSLCKTLLAFALLHSALQGQICLLLQVFLDFLLLQERISDPTSDWPRLSQECTGLSSRGVGWKWPAAGLGASECNSKCMGSVEGGLYYLHYFHQSWNQSWILIGRTDAEAETPILWPPDVKNWLTGKDPDAGIDWRQEEKGMTGWDGWVVSPTQWTWVWVNSGNW